MYVPEIYSPATTAWVKHVICNFPLAALLTNGPEFPFATHCPVILGDEEDFPESGEVHLLGHMDRRNPQWASMAGACPAKLIFTGPQSYITPAIYGIEEASPTWDFVSVHISGTVQPMESRAEAYEVVTRTVARFEARFGENWNPESSLAYFHRIVSGVGAFRFTGVVADGMFKLSQEKPPEIQARIVDALRHASSGSARHLGEIMHCYRQEAAEKKPARGEGR